MSGKRGHSITGRDEFRPHRPPTELQVIEVARLLPHAVDEAVGRRHRTTVRVENWEADFLVGGKAKPQQVTGWVRTDTPGEY